MFLDTVSIANVSCNSGCLRLDVVVVGTILVVLVNLEDLDLELLIGGSPMRPCQWRGCGSAVYIPWMLWGITDPVDSGGVCNPSWSMVEILGRSFSRNLNRRLLGVEIEFAASF